MSNDNSSARNRSALFATIVIPITFVVALLIYHFVLGSPSNFQGGDVHNAPMPGNYLGIIYSGGPIVPILMTIDLLVVVFSIERFLTISKSRGVNRLEPFVRKVKELLSAGEIDSAISECDTQKGSVANIIRSGLQKYKQVENEQGMEKEGKLAAIQKELEEATSLELPMLSKNLVIISTCASIATLVGLIGTVIGMIKAFAALAQAGAPDAVALASGISEALINTALGIIGSAIAIVMYNFFTTKIDTLTYGIDEAGFSIVQTFSATHKNHAVK